MIRLKNGQLVSGYLGSAPDAQAIYQAVFKEETEKTETPEGTEVVEKAEKTLPESPLRILSRMVARIQLIIQTSLLIA